MQIELSRIFIGRPGALALAALMLATFCRAQTPGPGYDIEMSRMIPMRDGTELEAWITKPSVLKAPVLLL